ncbi:MAG TPA: acyl carrier protein [Thermoanaerobaculia bacterium]|jgi:acyl carrier protein|nr:acyl carrier protein [Thermoanaerobaculia bacterium]
MKPEESPKAVLDSARAAGPPTSDAIQSWLVQKISARLHVPAEQIRPAEPFTSFGLSSMVALSLSGELEELVGLQLPPTLMWDYPTIDSLSQHLAQLAADARAKRG